MKLAILGTRGIPARYGGFETFAEQLATRLARLGADVTVFCPCDSPKNDATYSGTTLKYVKYPSAGMFSELLWDIRCFWEARRGFEVVYMLGVGAGFAAWIPRISGAAVWVNSDGIEWKRSKWTWPQRIYLAVAEALSVLFATRVIADAAAIADYLRKRYPGYKRIATIPYGADIPVEKPDRTYVVEWDLLPDGYYLIVCRLEPENHVIEIIEGFNATDSPFPLVVLGNIENPNPYVQKLIAYRGDRIRFAGTVYEKSRLTALRYYARAYVHGHSVGGTNPSLLEAIACSSLVIAHDNPFNREVLGESGLYFTTRDELASHIRSVDSDCVDRNMRRQMAKEIVRSRYRWDQIADAYLKLLKESISRDATSGLDESKPDMSPESRLQR